MNVIKIAISFLAGAAVGFGGAILYWRKRYTPEIQKELEEMQKYSNDCRKYADEMRTYAESMYNDLKSGDCDFESAVAEYRKRKEEARKNIEKSTKEQPDDHKKQKSLYNQTNTKRIDYSKIYDNLFSSSDPAENEHPEDDQPSDPEDIFIISEEQYNTPFKNHKKVELSYYYGCGTIAKVEYNASTEEFYLTDPEKHIGSMALYHFAEYQNDNSEVFVRNTALCEDYKITKYNGTYKEIVLGIYD